MFKPPVSTRGAGIRMDKDTLAATSPIIVKLFCLHCGSTHERRIKCGRLSEACVPEIPAEPKPAEAPALTIAIYALSHILVAARPG
jgi:hypothetical protein